MLAYVIRRLLTLIPLLALISIVSFTIIELPPGSYVDTYVANLEANGGRVTDEQVAQLKAEFGLDQPVYVQYALWMRNILLRGDFGRSFEFQKPVVDVLGERVILSMIITLTTSLFVWGASLPIGIYAATHQYSFFDYFWTFLGFIGLAVPNFLLALLIAWIVYTQFGLNVVGLFSQQYQDAPWSVAKGIDLLRHLWAPVIVIGMAHTAGFIRIVRGTLLDELQKPYVVAARARGLSERRLLVKYPVRVVLNPMISTIGWTLPALVSGEVIVSLVLGIPTTGPILLQALMSKDMYLAGGIFLILSSLTIVGTLVSDILLTWLDPRIRYERLAR